MIRAVTAAGQTNGAAACLTVDCAHPDHFRPAPGAGTGWLRRIGGVGADASRLIHAGLDEAAGPDEGSPPEFGRDHAVLSRMLTNLRVLGGCCGTDHRHIEAMADCCLSRRAA